MSNRLKSNILPLGMSIVTMLFLYFLQKPMFETNDDMALIGILSGQYGMKGSPDASFISLLLGKLIFELYKLNSNIPWYSGTLYLFQIVSCYFAFKLILAIIHGKVERIVLCLGYVSLYNFMFYRLSFTSTSLLMWFTASLYIGYLNINKKPVHLWEVFLGVFLGLSYLLRPSILKIAISFTLLLLITFLLSVTKKRFWYVMVPLLVIITSSVLVQHDSKDNNFKTFNHARSFLMDTGLGASSQNTKTALEMTGWTEEDLYLARLWWMYDENIYSVDKINNFLKYNKGENASLISIDKGRQWFSNSQLYFAILGLCAITLFLAKTINYNLPENAYIIGVALLVITILGIYMLATIRFPARISFPIYIYLLCLTILIRPLFPEGSKIRYKFVPMFLGTLFLLYITSINFNSLLIDMNSGKNDKEYTYKSFILAKDINGVDTVFVNLVKHSVTQYVNPFKEFREMPKYKQLTGGWLIRTPIYYENLGVYGFSNGKQVVPSMVNNDKIVFTCYDSQEQPYNVYSKYLINHIAYHYKLTPKIEIVLDRRFVDLEGQVVGWVFFKMQS